jgi:NitT/TauT family transport system substrate-binding protein
MLQRTVSVWLAALALWAVGCDRKGNSGATSTSAPLAEVRLGFFPNVTHAQAVLGVASGDFAKAIGPAKLTTRQFNAGPSLIEALFAKQIDVGYVGPGPVITAWARSHGEGIRVISGAAADGVVIVAGKDAGIKTMADLKGRKIATPQHGNTQDIAARHYVTAILGQADANNVLAIPNADQAATMARGQVDAAWVPEPWGALLMRSAGAELVGQEKDLWPGKTFALTVVVTTPEFLAAHADVVAKLLAVNHDWTAKLAANPGAYAGQLDDALASLTGKRLPPGVTADALTRVKFSEDPSPATFDANAQWAYDLGFANDKPDLTDLVVPQRK